MFSGASNFSTGVDKTFLFIIGISFFFLLALTTIMIVFAFKYNRKKHPKAVQVKDNIFLEVTWTVIPTLLALLMFYYGYEAFIPERHPPKDAIQVKVIAKMWSWSFDYGDGKIVNDTLVVPLGKAVQLNLTSIDVIHSLYISAFRIKEDVVPGKPGMMWFIAQKIGQYDILCAEFCGVRHSYMEGIVKVVPVDDYTTWLSNLKTSNNTAGPKGLVLIQQNACIGCHSLDGSKLVGPSFKDLYNREEIVITEGKERKIKADDAYIRNSIINPNADVVKGFNGGMMISYKGILNDSAINEIILYIKQISGKPN